MPGGSLDQPLGLGGRQRAGERPGPAGKLKRGGRIVLARAEQHLVPEERAHGCDAPGSGRGSEAGGAHLGEPALELLGRRLRDRPSTPRRELCEVAPVRVHGARRPPRREQREEAVEIRVGAACHGRYRFPAADPASSIRPWMGGVVDAAEPARVDVAVDLRGRERRVPEQLLDRPQIGSALEQMGRERVPQPVRVGEKAAERARVEPPAARGEKECVVRPAGELRSRIAQVPRDDVGCLLAERDDPLLAALAAHAHVLLFEVDVAQVEPDRLGASEAGGVDELDQRVVAQRERPVAVERVDDRLDLLPLRRLRQALRAARPERGIGDAGRAERETEKGAHGGQVAGDRGGREPVARPAELRRVVDERADVDLLDRRPALLEPVAEAAQVGRIGAARRLGERGRGEEAVDRGFGRHRDALSLESGHVLRSSHRRRGALDRHAGAACRDLRERRHGGRAAGYVERVDRVARPASGSGRRFAAVSGGALPHQVLASPAALHRGCPLGDRGRTRGRRRGDRAPRLLDGRRRLGARRGRSGGLDGDRPGAVALPGARRLAARRPALRSPARLARSWPARCPGRRDPISRCVATSVRRHEESTLRGR